jgi:hypothetical protein
MSKLNGDGLTKPVLDELRAKVGGAMLGSIGGMIDTESDRKAEQKVAAILRGSPHTVTSFLWDVANALKQVIEAHVALKAHVVELEQRNAELEATAVRYEGIWDEQRDFHPNTMVTYGGNLWICEEVNSNVRPGTSDDWQLMQKTKGRQ